MVDINPQESERSDGTKPIVLAQENSNSLFFDVYGKEDPFFSQGKGAAETACPTNAIYNELVETLYRRSYDPSSLGDFETAKNKYNCEIKSDEDAVKFADKFTEESSDPHDDVIPKDEFERFQRLVTGAQKGIGITMQIPLDADNRGLSKGPILVERITPDSNADRAGLKRGDKILSVDGLSTDEVNQFDVARRISDPATDTIEFVVERGGEELTLNIPKTEISKSAVHAELDGNIAYIKIDTFLHDNLAEDLKAALLKYKDADGFVLDIRDNTGGYFDAALEAASLFVDEGEIITAHNRLESDPNNPQYENVEYGVDADNIYIRVSRDGEEPGAKTKHLDRMPDLVDKPVRVLINGYSASASEIFASAVEGNGDAQIVGVNSYGKGDGQTVKSGFSTGAALKYTNFRFKDTRGRWFGDGKDERYGVEPNYYVANEPGSLRMSAEDKQYRIALLSIQKELADQDFLNR